MKIERKIIFFIRHENDLDFLFPILISCKNKKIIFWKKVDENDYRIKYLKQKKNCIYFLRYYQQSFFIKASITIVGNISRRISKIIANMFEKIELIMLKNSLIKLKDKIQFNEFDIIAFDHISGKQVKTIIDLSKQYNKKIITISLPHGINFFKNFVTEYNQTSIEKKNYNIFDHVFCSDENHFNIFENNKKIIIQSPRYTNAYINFFIENILKFDNIEKQNEIYQKNILYVHSKINGNIHFNEIKRLFKIVEKYKNLSITIKKHPRGGYKELKKIIPIKKYKISENHILQSILSCDFVICIQSIAIIDALLLNKIVIVPTYFTSNIIEQKILDYCIVIKSPDELINLVNNLSKNKLKIDKKILKIDNYDKILLEWKNALEKL